MPLGEGAMKWIAFKLREPRQWIVAIGKDDGTVVEMDEPLAQVIADANESTWDMGIGIARIMGAFSKRKVHITVDPDSPWHGVKVEPAWGEEATPENAERTFAVWKDTQDVYLEVDGAVADDPIPVETPLASVLPGGPYDSYNSPEARRARGQEPIRPARRKQS